MLRVGITGGMGCGKSTMAHIFSVLGIPVYKADERAKAISAQAETKAGIARLFGAEAASDKSKLAAIVFSDARQLAKLNALIHPSVVKDMENWFKALENSPEPPPYALVETAILFESGMENHFDCVINVNAPVQEQIARCMARDHCTEEEVRLRLARQFPAEKRQERSRFTIQNACGRPVLRDVLAIDGILRQEA